MHSQPLTSGADFCYNTITITKRIVMLLQKRHKMRVLNQETLERVAQYNIDYQKKHGKSPSFREIMHALDLGSLATVQRYVRALQKSNRLEVTNMGNIQLLPQLAEGSRTVIPLSGYRN